ncbi:helix-turn-helix transcriptional regulator [Streptomonospora salina]
MVSAIERGTRSTKRDQAESLDAALATDGRLTRLWENLVKQESVPDWFQHVVALEHQASELRMYHTSLVPGLLQTADYARTVLRYGRPWDCEDAIERLVKSRMERQEVLAKEDRPLLWTVVDEVVVRRAVGTPGMMHEQLAQLLKLTDSQQSRLQIIPEKPLGHPGLSGPFRLMSFHDKPTVAYVEHMLGGELVDQPDDVRHCSTIFGALQAEALSPRASADLIREVEGALDD